jgi:RNA recognition motif-containing protein
VNCTVVRMMGAPFNAKQKDVVNFFEGIPVAGITSVIHKGSNVEYFIAFENENDANEALKRNKQYIGKRYVDLIPSDTNLLQNVKKVFKNINTVVKLKGISYELCTEDEIKRFFDGFSIASIYIPKTQSGKPMGEAYVSFINEDEASRALNNNKKYLGSRYIILEQSKPDATCFLRGFPFSVTGREVRAFLSGYNVTSVRLRKVNGQPTGEAFVVFDSEEEKKKAMQELHKANYGGRYIEFLEPNRQKAQ